MKKFRRPFLTLLRKTLVLSLFTFLMARNACPAWFLGFLVAVALLQGFGYLIMKNRHLFVTLRISHLNAAVQFAWLFLLSLDVTHPQFQLPSAFILLGYCFLTSLQVVVFFRYLFRAKGTLNRLFPMDSFSSAFSSSRLLLFALLSLPANAWAGDRAVRWLEDYFPLAHFQIGGLATFGGGTYSVGPQISWNPTLVLGPVYFRGDLGVSKLYVKGGGTQTLSSYQLLGGIGIDTGMIEVGGGMQILHGTPNVYHPLATILFVSPFLPKRHFIFERVYLGYTACFRSGHIMHETRLGVGVGF